MIFRAAIFNHMVDDPDLDAVFTAVSNPVRRDILLQLTAGPQRVGDLAKRYAISLNAVSKHIKTLEAAALVTREVQGREHLLTANPVSLMAAMAWMRHYEQFWNERLDALTAILENPPDSPGAKP
jgi:DNA-binding transcriptional ArsR family regulator